MGTITNSNIFNGVAVAGNKITGMAKGGNIFYRHEGSYAPFATPILDLDFQNNFIDKSPSGLTMVQGQGLPTFGLSGRKAGEYCVNFNGSQSIKTTTNLPLNSDKVCVKFWMKTSQTSTVVVCEMNNHYALNSFGVFLNNIASTKIDLANNQNGAEANNNIVSTSDSVLNNWVHLILTIDRNSNNESKIFINGQTAYITHSSYSGNNNGNFVNNILYIGQRAGNSYGFVGSLMKCQIFNGVPTDAQAMDMYLNDL